MPWSAGPSLGVTPLPPSALHQALLGSGHSSSPLTLHSLCACASRPGRSSPSCPSSSSSPLLSSLPPPPPRLSTAPNGSGAAIAVGVAVGVPAEPPGPVREGRAGLGEPPPGRMGCGGLLGAQRTGHRKPLGPGLGAPGLCLCTTCRCALMQPRPPWCPVPWDRRDGQTAAAGIKVSVCCPVCVSGPVAADSG